MGTTVVARQVLRWTVGTTVASSLSSPLQVGRYRLLRPRCLGSGLLCSSSSQNLTQSRKHLSTDSHGSGTSVPLPVLSLQSLTDLGFTEEQAAELQTVASQAKGRTAAKNALPTLTALLLLGLNSASVHKMLLKCPELLTLADSQLQQSVGNLRKLGFIEGSLQRVVAYYPRILTVPVKTVKQMVTFLRESCLFTVQQVKDILKDSPSIVLEDQGDVEYKFQYVYFRMGIKQSEMMKAKLFRFSLDEIRCRHLFLERRGLHQTPDKKGQTLIINPTLNRILPVSEDTFVRAVAKASPEEYEVFQRLMAREWQEEEWDYGRIEADGDDDDDDDYDDNDHRQEQEEDDDDEEEEEDTDSKSQYRKKKRRNDV